MNLKKNIDLSEPMGEYYKEEITLKDLIENILEFVRELWKEKLLIFIISLPFIAFMIFKSYVSERTYPAEISFTVNEDSGGGAGALTGVLGQFGLGGGVASEYNLDKILDLAKSRRIISRSLFSEASDSIENEFLANRLIRLYDLNQNWKDELHGFLFKSRNIENETEQAALKAIHSKVVGNSNKGIEGIVVTGYNEATGILKLTVSSVDPKFSVDLCKSIYEQLSKFYVEKTVEPQKSTLSNLEGRSDSLRQELAAAEYALARFMDTNRSLISAQSSIKGQRQQRKVAILSGAYGKVLENLEMAKFTLDNSTPFFQVIDEPMLPIEPVEVSVMSNLLLGLLLGLFVACIFVIVRKIILDALA